MEYISDQHVFSVYMASKYGIEAAILLHDLTFWVRHNAKNGKNFHDGKYWTYNSIKAFRELYPYMTESAIRRALKMLEEEGLIEVGNYNKSAYDRTKWYAVTEKAFAEMRTSICQNSQMEMQDSTNPNFENAEPIPDTDKDTNQMQKQISRKKPKKAHGEFENVKLTDEEFEKVRAKFPDDFSDRIERLSLYKEQTGRKYKSDYATILTWARKDEKAADVPLTQTMREVIESADSTAKVWSW
jgi:DNA-binding PadR family transcriptional regulator